MATNEPSLNQLVAGGLEAIGSHSVIRRGRGRPKYQRDWSPVIYYRRIHPDMVACMDELLSGLRTVQKAQEGDVSGLTPTFNPAA
jgi:hypothetical protein